MNDNSWMNNPSLKNIDPAKLQLLSSLAGQAQGKSQKELLPFLMAAAPSGSATVSENTAPASEAGNPARTSGNSPTDPALNAADNEPGNLSFDTSERDAIIEVLKAGKSPQEIRKIDRILSIMKMIK